MRLANRVLLCALAIFILASVASAQTLRNENDPRNLSPSVGTGGPVGWAHGTVYYLRRFDVASRRVYVKHRLQQLRPRSR